MVDGLNRTVSWLDARGHGFAALCLAAMTLALYHHALSGWWFADDPLHLKEAILHSPVEYFFVPGAWQEFMAAYFTPLLTLSYDIDYTLFGLDPAPFYAHQLVSIALAGLAFYLLLTLWVSRSFALAGAALLLLTTPIALASTWLAVRHYTEGLALASLALYAWVAGLRQQSAAWRWGGVALYLLAMLAKEVYVPLVGLMVLVPEGRWKDRLRASWPFWVILAVFLLWRFWMLGGHIGGYGLFEPDWLSVAPMMAVLALFWLPFTFFWKLFGGGWVLPVFLGLFSAVMVSLVRGAWLQRLGFIVAVVIICSAPLLPVVGDVPPEGAAYTHRFVTVPAAALVFALTVGLARLGPGGSRRALALLVLGMTGMAFWGQSHSMLETWHDPARMKQEGKFLLDMSPETHALVVPAHTADAFYRGLYWLRGHLGRGRAPAIVYGGYFGLEPGYGGLRTGQRIYRYEQQCHCFQDVTDNVLKERENIIKRMADRPLTASVTWGHGRLSWSLGPFEQGKYFLLAGQTPDWYLSHRKVARQGFIIFLLEGYMRVGYESPEGWMTFSPEFHVNLAEQGQFAWAAPSPGAGGRVASTPMKSDSAAFPQHSELSHGFVKRVVR